MPSSPIPRYAWVSQKRERAIERANFPLEDAFTLTQTHSNALTRFALFSPSLSRSWGRTINIGWEEIWHGFSIHRQAFLVSFGRRKIFPTSEGSLLAGRWVLTTTNAHTVKESFQLELFFFRRMKKILDFRCDFPVSNRTQQAAIVATRFDSWRYLVGDWKMLIRKPLFHTLTRSRQRKRETLPKGHWLHQDFAKSTTTFLDGTTRTERGATNVKEFYSFSRAECLGCNLICISGIFSVNTIFEKCLCEVPF